MKHVHTAVAPLDGSFLRRSVNVTSARPKVTEIPISEIRRRTAFTNCVDRNLDVRRCRVFSRVGALLVYPNHRRVIYIYVYDEYGHREYPL